MVVASMPRQAPHGSDELAADDDAPRSEQFEESVSKDSRVSFKKDDGEA